MISIEEFQKLLNSSKETEHLEFKEAKDQFNFENGSHSLSGYLIALANEGGGVLILGVSDQTPRDVVGTAAFKDTKKLEADIYRVLNRRVMIDELIYEDKRVIIINVSSRPIGQALSFKGQYLMRINGSLESMTDDQLKRIHNEGIDDYSSKIISEASYNDLSTTAILELRSLLKKSHRVNKDIDQFNDMQLLQDLGLIIDNKVTVAALVLLAEGHSLERLLPYSEIRFGYKIDEGEIRNQDTEIYTEGYLLFYNKIWEKINSRNLSFQIPYGLRLVEKKVFQEESIREAINNAIIHRDYSEKATVIIIQSQYKIAITSPGGLLKGIDINNLVDKSQARNKLIANVLYKCEFVEQFGNGVNLMIRNQLSLGKDLPDYSKSDKYSVIVSLDGKVKDIEFAKYVYKVADKLGKYLNDEELRMLCKIKDGEKVGKNRISDNLVELGILEKNENDYILHKDYYVYINKPGIYTRKRGLDKETNKLLIIKHLEHYKKGYMKDFMDALKIYRRITINRYLNELRDEMRIELVGNPAISRGEDRTYWRLINSNDTGK